jgi:putative nucleotidyltransferase with HDIG domain
MGFSHVLGTPAKAFSVPARNIRWKIIAPYAALTIVLAVAGTYLVARLVGGSLDERFNNQLAEASRVASDSLVRRERKHLEAVRAVAFTDGVSTAVDARDPARLKALVEPIVANQSLERVEVLDTTGTRIYGGLLYDPDTLTYTSVDEPENRASWPLVQKVLAGQRDAQGDKFTEIVYTPGGDVLYTAGPILDGTRVAGVVLVGTPLASFLAGAQSEALADVTIYGETGFVRGTTFPAADAADKVTLAPSETARDSDGSTLVRERRSLYGRDYDLLYGRLYIRGEFVGYYSVGLPSSFIFSAQTTTRMQMAVLFTFAIVAALFVGWFVSRTITDPVKKLAAAAIAVTDGDLLARSGVDGRDEIGTLGRAFDAMTERLQRQHLATVRALTSAIDARDPYTMGHSLRVGQLAVELGIALGLPPATLQHLEIGGYLHDIGKIGVRDSVLLKPGALDPEERAAIERHPTIGMEILDPVDLAPEVLEFVGGHHEKLDGRGYPQHLHAEQLSIIPRIAAVADIYDALVTDRPYRAGMSTEKALSILYKEANEGQLELRIVETMERIAPRWEERRLNEPGLKGYSVTAAAPLSEVEQKAA